MVTGLWRNRIISNVIPAILFSQRDESFGVCFAKRFQPISLELLALLWTLVCDVCCSDRLSQVSQIRYAIDEYETGQKPTLKTSFMETVYKKVYKAYLADLKKWEGMNPEVVKTFRITLFEKARYGNLLLLCPGLTPSS